IDGACSGDDTIDRCEDGSSCGGGVRKQHLPVTDSVTTTTVNSGRDLVVAVGGTDADLVLKKAALTFSGGTADKLENITIGALNGLPHQLTWDGPAFKLEVRFVQWGNAVQAARTSVSATITDNADIVSAAVSGVIL